METTEPQQIETFIISKLQKKQQGGRPHFLKEISIDADPKEKLLDILELAWLKDKSVRLIARKYKVSHQTIRRILEDLKPYKQEIKLFLELVPRRKVFWNRTEETSDYETIQAYIRRAKRDELVKWKKTLALARKCWTYLKYKDPTRWTAQETHDFLSTKTEGSQARYLDCIRQVAPQIADRKSLQYIKTSRYREKLRLRKKDLFGSEVKMMLDALTEMGLHYHATILKLHITLGCREGGKKANAGMTYIQWEHFKKDFTRLDIFESKVRGGIWWRNCPIDLFWKNLPKEIWSIWVERDKPTTDRLVLGGYRKLLKMYKEMRLDWAQYFKGKLEPSLFKEITTLRPHDADRIHCNLLWEADVKLEVVAGQYLGRGEGLGLMGRGWLDINTIKKHYLSLTQRSERFQKIMDKVRVYSERFNEAEMFKAIFYESNEKGSEQKAAVLC
jgi:predicted DNA-binding protein YlxM (UPF0122 family)